MPRSKSGIATDLKKFDAHVIAPHEYEDAPELTDEQLASALREGPPLPKQHGRPKTERPKQAVKLRLDADVLSAYRAFGRGWQTRINADLRAARRLDHRRKAARR